MHNDAEQWKPVIGYEGLYEVSDHGRVRSLDYRHTGIAVILKTAENSDGYKQTFFFKNGVRKTEPVHSVVARAFIGERPDGYQVNHISGVKADNRACNLEYVTPSRNGKHAVEIGLKVPIRGEKHWKCRLSDYQVLEIKRLLVLKRMTQCEIAAIYGVGQQHISDIKHSQTRKDLLRG